MSKGDSEEGDNEVDVSARDVSGVYIWRRDLNKMGKSSRMMMEISWRRRRCWFNFNAINLESALASWKNKADPYKNGVKSSAVGLQGHVGDCDALKCFCDF
ncbi:hypothetical protein BY996DRAFT_6565057 [Phakopsora pachyrhizi]|nr:hypothetical protein BY996DRAFT_6565057 [Phakopsora pachyrhizi]